MIIAGLLILDVVNMAHPTDTANDEDVMSGLSFGDHEGPNARMTDCKRGYPTAISPAIMEIDDSQSLIPRLETLAMWKRGQRMSSVSQHHDNRFGDNLSSTTASLHDLHHYVSDKENNYAGSQMPAALKGHHDHGKPELKDTNRLGYLQGKKKQLHILAEFAKGAIEPSGDKFYTLINLDYSITLAPTVTSPPLDAIDEPYPSIEHAPERDLTRPPLIKTPTKPRRTRPAATETAAIKSSDTKSHAALLYFRTLRLSHRSIPQIFASCPSISPERKAQQHRRLGLDLELAHLRHALAFPSGRARGAAVRPCGGGGQRADVRANRGPQSEAVLDGLGALPQAGCA